MYFFFFKLIHKYVFLNFFLLLRLFYNHFTYPLATAEELPGIQVLTFIRNHCSDVTHGLLSGCV